MAERKKISKELQDLVSWSVDLLGQAIKSQYGIKRFNQVESLRQSMKGLRRLSDEKSYETLSKEQKKLKSIVNSNNIPYLNRISSSKFETIISEIKSKRR